MRTRGARVLGVNLALVVVGASLALTTSVAPSSPAAAVAVTVGPVEAQMANHHGTTVDTSSFGGGNCIRYSPVSPILTQSTFVANPNEARTAHGRDGQICPSTLNTSQQSAMGFRPSPITTVEDGTQFLIGRMVHYNNPIQASDRYFVGELNVRLGGFDGDPELDFPWTLDETPNQGSAPNDEIAFSSQISAITVTQGGLVFRLVIAGFRPIGSIASCPPTAQGDPVNEFSTVEGTQTHACLYASLQQERSLTIVKQVVGSPPQARTFGYTSSSSLAGSAWANGSFSLAAGGDRVRSLTSGETVTVTETDPGEDRWTLTALTCTQIGANGQPVSVPGATINLAARQMTLTNVPPPPNPNQPGITCTFTNTYTPKATLTLVKQVATGSAPPSAWTLTATGPDTISGPSGDAAVTAQRVRAGTYLLTETGTGQAETGYVQQGNWVCQTGAGANVPVTPGGSVTLTDSAASNAGARVTCTVTNRLATGSLQINKVVADPLGGYTGGTSKTFAGNYNCGAGFSAPFSTLTTASPVVIAGIPAGRTCTVTETPPTGGLANVSFVWGPATFSAQPVTITDQATAEVTITNHVIQQFGTFAVTKVVQGPGGYSGGANRVFPVDYSCTLAGAITASGTLDATLGGPESPAGPIPVGSVCSFTEAPLAEQPGDFVDPSYSWSDSTLSPTTVTIAVATTSAVTLTNIYIQEFGSLVIAKEVVGDGYLGAADENFTVQYTCGTDFEDTVTVADGGTVTIDGLPANITCNVQEFPLPDEDLLAPGFDWGTPTWDPGVEATIPANGSTTLTVSNPTVAVFGQVRVTKEITGETQGVVAGATFEVIVSCDNGDVFTFALGVGVTESTPDLPVGTSCTVTETDPVDGLLVDSSYDWGATTIDPETVTITASGDVVEVTVTNNVVRVTGSLTITKAPITPAGVVDPARTFSIGFRCVYGEDPPVTGTVSLAQNATANTPPVFLGSQCTVIENPATLEAPPDPEDPTWVWLPVTYAPDPPVVVVDSATTPVTVTVVNSIRQLTGQFSVTKVVVGEGKDGGYDGGAFNFTLDCGGTVTDIDLVDGASFDSPPVVAGTSCTLTEDSVPPPTGPEFGWDQVTFTINGEPAGTGDSVTFVVPGVPPGGDPLQINVTNPITPRFGSVTVTKTVTGATAGLAPDAPPFAVHLDCEDGRIFDLDVPANGSATQDNIPAGSECTATEAEPTGGLVDESYAWGDPTYTAQPVTVVVGETATIGITNPIERVTAPVRLVKTYTGPQGVDDPTPTDRTYPVTWTCTYNGEVVAGPTLEDIVADPNGIEVAPAVPITSECTATEGDLGTPSDDPAFRWLDPIITGTTVSLPGPNTMTVANELVRDNGQVIVQKDVTGAIEGYIGGDGENFALVGRCAVPGTDIPARWRAGSIANEGEVIVAPVSVGWTCTGVEFTPNQDLLADASYAWGNPIYTPSDPFVLTLEDPELIFHVENPIVRVRAPFVIRKVLDDPFGAVSDGTTFTGGWSCQYGGDRSITGDWSITLPDTTFEPPDQILLESECTVTENPPDPSELPDDSYAWGTPVIDGPTTVVPGGTATVTVTNTVERVFGGLEITKTVVDPDGGVLPGAAFPGVWECTQGENTYSGRYTVGPGETTTAFTPEDERVPALAECTITEDTPFVLAGLRDDSFAWGAETYEPLSVILQPGATATLGVTNTVIRVYSDVTVRKVVTGPAADLVPDDREFNGTISCRYGADAPIETTWAATTATPALRAGVLVESVCTATEEAPGITSGPVVGDSSYVWLEPIVSGAATVVLPDQPRPEIVVTNPTDRLFGTFDVTKVVTGDTEGIVDPTEPYHMEFECTSLSGEQISGELEVPARGTRAVGPGQQIPTGSTCTLTEPLAGMPGLVDETFSWGPPTFTVDGQPVDGEGGQISFMIPTPQEDEQEPNVAIVVTNPVRGQPASELEITKQVTSGPDRNADGTFTLAYDVVVSNTGGAPIAYDLTDEFLFADGVVVTEVAVENVRPGDIPVNENFDGDTDQAIASATIAAGANHRYRITVTADVSEVTSVEALDCQLDPGEDGTGFLNRATVNPSAEACAPIDTRADVRLNKVVDRTTVVIDPANNVRTRLTYTIVVTNDGPGVATDVVVTDTLPGGVVPVSAVPSVGSCTRVGAILTCELGTMAPGAEEEIVVTIELLPTQPVGPVRNSAEVETSSPGDDPDNNVSAVVTVVRRPGQLPATGNSGLATPLTVATTLLLAGSAMVVVARRRRRAVV